MLQKGKKREYVYPRVQDFKEILIELRNKNKKYAPVYYYLGLIAYDEHQYDLSEANHKTAIELDPNYAEPYFELSGKEPPESLEEWAADMIIPKRDDNTIYTTRPEV